MNIAVIIDQDPQIGGGFQQALSCALLLNRNNSDSYRFHFFSTKKPVISVLEKYDLRPIHFELTLLQKLLIKIISYPVIHRLMGRLGIKHKNKFDRLLDNYGVDLIYFTTPTSLALFTQKHNYIFTVLDLCHRDYPEFPEMKTDGEFEIRENLFSRVTPKAISVITDSKIGRNNLIHRYNLDEKRVKILGFLPSIAVQISDEQYERNFVNIKERFKIPGDYIFYPAQFWPHKNHVYILNGLKLLSEKHNIRFNAVFSGSDRGNLKTVLNYAEKINILNNVFYIGFAPDELMPYLYKQSIALVMPSYFGPTNIPPLEAFFLGVPVLYSNLEVFRDQVGDAALFMDLSDPLSMVQHLLNLINDSDLKTDLIQKGKKRLKNLYEHDHWQILKNIFDDHATILETWKTPG